MNEDTKIIQHIIDGDLAAFKILIEKYQRLVWMIIRAKIHHKQETEDLSQEVFLKVYQGLPRFRGESGLATWIGKIAHHTALNYLRKKYHRCEYPIDFSNESTRSLTLDKLECSRDPVIELESSNRAYLIEKSIASLPQHYALIIRMFHLEELNYQEIGEILKLPAGTVKTHLFRARKLLKKNLETQYKPEEITA